MIPERTLTSRMPRSRNVGAVVGVPSEGSRHGLAQAIDAGAFSVQSGQYG